MKLFLLILLLCCSWSLAGTTTAWAAPTPAVVWASVRPYPTTQTSIPALNATTTGTISQYDITTVMSTAQGVVYVNGTAVTTPQALTTTQATQLTFIPANGFMGNAYFLYTATDGTGTSAPTSYSVPVSNSSCGNLTTNRLNFSTAISEDWKNHANVAVSGTSFGTSGYAAPEATVTNTFATGISSSLIGPTLIWGLSSTTTNVNAATDDVATVTFTFSRPVNNLSLAVQDIDSGNGGGFIDEATFDGYATAGATTPITLIGSNVGLSTNSTNAFVGSGSTANSRNNTVKGTADNTVVAGTVVVTFPSAVQKLVLTYRNSLPYAANQPRTQGLGIQSMSWCAQNDVTASFTTAPTTANTGASVSYTVGFGNNGVDAAVGATRVVTLPAGVTVTNAGGGTYNSSNNTIDFGTETVPSARSNSFTYTYTAPTTAGTYTNTATTSTAGDDPNNANNSASNSLTVAVPLPVVLVAFTAQAVQNRYALLSWITASELNSDYFEVERSLDGTSFTKMGTVAGHGTTAVRFTYAYVDASEAAQAAGLVYYRLRQVDFNGTAVYSPVRTVTFTGKAASTATLHPNPAATASSLDLSALPATGLYQVVVLDATGRQVQRTTLGGGLVQSLPLSSLATGTYQVLVSGQQVNGALFYQILRLVKE